MHYNAYSICTYIYPVILLKLFLLKVLRKKIPKNILPKNSNYCKKEHYRELRWLVAAIKGVTNISKLMKNEISSLGTSYLMYFIPKRRSCSGIAVLLRCKTILHCRKLFFFGGEMLKRKPQ